MDLALKRIEIINEFIKVNERMVKDKDLEK